MKWLLLSLIASVSYAQGIAGLSPAEPDMMAQVPVMYFGVRACGEYVIWLTYEDGRMRRIDKDHSPKDMHQFLKTLEDAKIPGDVVVIRCSDSL
jgi:hypothetical protein